MGLVDDVLFIEDPYEKGKYHPRISAQYTYQYRCLNDYEKWCFNRLYNDFYYRRNNDFWYGQAMWKMPPLIEATDMLVCRGVCRGPRHDPRMRPRRDERARDPRA